MTNKKLSIHRSSKRKFNSENFGHYLAGLIDGDGHISTIGRVVIYFSSKDIKSAYELRAVVGYGNIYKIKNKKCFVWSISKKADVRKIALLIKNKLKHPDKICQYNERLVDRFQIEKTEINSSINWSTPWLSGFFDADGYARIYIVHRESQKKPRVRLLLQIDQKTDVLLKQIKQKFGGFLGHRISQNTYYYSSTSFGNFCKFLKFFDKFSLQFDRTYLKYVILRKAYLVVQEKKHLQKSGFKTILKYQQKLSKI